jgi:iron complex outermembrane receptor protein
MGIKSSTAVSLIALATALAVSGAAQAAGAPAASPETRQVDELIVTAQQQRKQVESGGDVGVLGRKDPLAIPFNLTTYTSKLILDQQSETIGAVLLNDPTVRVTYGSGNQSESFVIRGFTVTGDDIAFDGLYGILPRQLVSPELFDNVQVLNGASAFAYGAAPGGSVGGTIDLSPKRATKKLARVTASYIQKSILGGSADLADRFGPDGEFGARFNTVYRTGDSAIHGEHREVRADSLDLDWSHGPLRTFVDMGYEDQRANRPRPEVKLAPGIAVPAPPSTTLNYGQPWSYTSLRDVYAVARAEFDITKDIEAYAAGGLRHGKEVGDYSTVTVTNAATGAGTGSRLFVPRQDHNFSGLVGLRAKFDTGPVSNELNVGASGVKEENYNSYTFGSFPPPFAASSTSFNQNLYNPVSVPAPTNSTLPTSGGSLTDLPLLTKTIFTSAFISDTGHLFDDHAELTVGVRHQNLEVHGFNRGTFLETSTYNKSADTPVVALVIKPNDHISVYANRTEALVQGPVAPTNAVTVNPGEIFAPFVITQYEVGGKLAYRGLTATLAAYQMKQPSAFAVPVPGSSTLTRFGVNGEQENRGVELTLNGEPTDYLRIIGGFALNDAKFTKALVASQVGHKAIGVPDYQANLGVEYNLPSLRNLVFTGRWILTGPQYLDAANVQKVPSWNRIDLGARYVAVFDQHPVTFRATVENVADKAYWESAYGGYLVQAEPRTVKASITFEY